MLCKIKLEKGEKPPIIFSPERRIKTIICPNCKRSCKAYYCESLILKNFNWVRLECNSCAYNEKLFQDRLDVIQPSSQLWDLIYGNNLFDQTEKRKKELAWAEEKRKEKLDYEYNKKFTKPWERKFVKDKVLKGDL